MGFALNRLGLVARHLFGLAAIVFGVATFIWHDFSTWQQTGVRGHYATALAYAAAMLQIVGGLAIQWPRTQRIGAILVGVIYFIFALLTLPVIVAGPRVYNDWNSFFEQFAQFAGALMLYATTGRSSSESAPRLARTAYIFFGLSVASFTLEQVFYLSPTASLVPKWIPPAQMFWAVATTIFFGLAALALLSGVAALLASRLLATMLISFQFLIWIPALFANPYKLFNWTENAENLSIAAAAWILADFLRQRKTERS